MTFTLSPPAPPSGSSTHPVPQTLAGKVAVVSGSSSGIGLAIAHELASRGAHVVANYPFAALAAAATAAVEALPTRSLAVCADLSTVEGPQRLAEAAASAFGRIDILVNNAALAVNLPLEEHTLKHWDQLVNLNARGTFLLTQQTLGHLPAIGGRIVNICSVSSRGAPPLQTIYAGTKGHNPKVGPIVFSPRPDGRGMENMGNLQVLAVDANVPFGGHLGR